MLNRIAIRPARPTIIAAGQTNPALSDGLLSMSIVENIDGLYRCEVLAVNWGNVNRNLGYLYFDRKTLDLGQTFTVKYGQDTIFDGRISGLEANYPRSTPPELNVLAEDRFQDLRMTRRTRTFMKVSDTDVISQIANEHGLNPVIDVTGPQYNLLAQVNQSDLAFLRERARSIDAELWMDGKTLHAQSRTKRNAGTVSLTYGRELQELTVMADLAHQRTSVIASGWDVTSKSALSHEATEDVISGELNGGSSGASILASTFGQRKEVLAHTVPLSSGEAQAVAESFFKKSARCFVVSRGVTDMNSNLRVGSYVELLKLGPLFSGKYYLTEVKYLFSNDTSGIRVEFTAERPDLGRGQ